MKETMILENLKEVQNQISHSCQRCGRKPEEIHLIAVSKTKPVSLLEEAYAAGVRDFGENKVQELTDKYEQLPKDIRWHMIGHLQRNKVKSIIDKVAMIHSVDSVRLAETISKEAGKKGICVPVLLEVNVAGEESKFGFSPEETPEAVMEISRLPHIRIEGLMTVAPFTEFPEENKKYFHRLKQLCVDIMQKSIDNVSMGILSMGMTGDYQEAIEEGATHIRVGTGIFGEREYKITI